MFDDTPGSSLKKQTEIADSAARARAESLLNTEDLPSNLVLLPVTQTTLFPGMIVPFVLPEGKLTRTLEHISETTGVVGVVLSRNANDEAVASGPSTSLTGLPADGSVAAGSAVLESGEEGDFHRFGVAARVLKKINLPDNQVSVLLTGIQRFEINSVTSREPYLVADVKYLSEEVEKGTELEALLRSSLGQFKQLSKDNPLVSEEVKVALVNIDGPGKLADFMASVLIRDVKDYQALLATADVRERLHHLLLLLKKEQDVQSVQRKIQEDINQKVTAAQREFYLQEQMKSIQKELGKAASDDRTRLVEKFKDRLEKKTLHPEARTRIEDEMEKLNTLHEQSSEYSVCINYLDWATSLPWGVRSPENYDLKAARRVLEEDHYGLKDVKERILEFLAVRKLKGTSEGSILCFVGPPGTGKTSLGRSIAKALERKFFRFSVGGMRDEAEIKGHRRTYVGAMPGKLIQGLKRIGTQNPVFLIDEIDKMGSSWATGGDPSSALLELLDPEQNTEFLDHYLDIPFDCSDVFFITTANTVDSIPSALLDRMEIIPLHGYSDSEKKHISRNYLIPKQLKKNALKASSLQLTDPALSYVISRYAREAGVRNLEKQISRICRKVAYRVATGKATSVRIAAPHVVEKFLGNPPFAPEAALGKGISGVATGLAWTQYGGEVLYIESKAVEGRGGIVLTGTLGKVMQESANIAYTYIRDKSKKLGLPRHFFDKNLFHLHVPAGAVPKDGPSAGITIAACLYSLLSKRPIKAGMAMTGELSLTGRVLPVGGIKEKLLAAKRAEIKTVILPRFNEKDLKEVEPEVKKGLTILKVSTMDDVLRHLF